LEDSPPTDTGEYSEVVSIVRQQIIVANNTFVVYPRKLHRNAGLSVGSFRSPVNPVRTQCNLVREPLFNNSRWLEWEDGLVFGISIFLSHFEAVDDHYVSLREL
jgi:hypothetical protein